MVERLREITVARADVQPAIAFEDGAMPIELSQSLRIGLRRLSAMPRLIAAGRELRESGLLTGLGGPAARRRTRALGRLLARGATVADLVAAQRANRLAHMMLRDALEPEDPAYTLSEVSRRSGVPTLDVERWFRALGRGVSKMPGAAYTDDDVALAARLAAYRGLGFDEEILFEWARLVGRNVWSTVDAIDLLLNAKLESMGRHNPEDALQLVSEVDRFSTFYSHLLGHVTSIYLSKQIHRASADAPASNAEQITVCFVDLVGFTRLGGTLSPTALGRLTSRLDALTTELVEPPVRFVKMVGDAVMLTSPDTVSLYNTVVAMSRAATAAGLPAMHAGIATGNAVPSAGDWIGQPVNLAARLAALAKPNEALADEPTTTRLAASEATIELIGRLPVKGFDEPQLLFRLYS